MPLESTLSVIEVTDIWNASKPIQNETEITTLYSLFSSTDVSSTGNQTSSSVTRFYPIIVAELMVSILCLVLSLVVYSILPEFRNVHGKNLTSLSSCLLTTFILLIFDIILRNRISYSFCFAIAIAIHITFLATFFWTNIMAFDIWRSVASMKAKSTSEKYSKKYFKYSIYAWTATVLTALPAAILELTNLVEVGYRPQFGVKRCWLSGITAFIYYFNLPVGVILFGNLILFLLTIRKLWLIKKMTSILPNKKDQQRLNLYLKLFLVMGITWLTEFIPWMTSIYKLYALAGMITALHGVFLFLIFVVKKRTLRQVWETFHLGKIPEVLKKSSTSQQTTSSSDPKSSSSNIMEHKV